MRKRTGSVYKRRGSWWARVTFVDPLTGNRRDLQRSARTRSEAIDRKDRLLAEIDASDGWAITHENRTFKELCDYYRENFACPPRYVNDRKVAGLRSYDTVRGQLAVLEKIFGHRKVRSITHDDLRRFKLHRLAEPTRTGSPRRIASVHRELALLSRLFSVALRQRWILANPFDFGDRLISPGDETERTRIITRAEEAALLAACDHPSREHLRPILIAALDTGMRQGEILKLRWSDIDWKSGIINVRFQHEDDAFTRSSHDSTASNGTRLAQRKEDYARS